MPNGRITARDQLVGARAGATSVSQPGEALEQDGELLPHPVLNL